MLDAYLDEALAAYRAAIAKNPRLPGLHFLIGNIEWKKRDFEAAKPEMEAELLLNPHHALANLRFGQIMLAMDRPGPAADYLRDAVRADDSSIEAHRALGKLAGNWATTQMGTAQEREIFVR